MSLPLDNNYFGILLWKIVKPRDHNKIKPLIGTIFQKHNPIRHYFVMSQKKLSWSFVNKVHNNCNNVSYLQKNKNAKTWKPLFRRKGGGSAKNRQIYTGGGRGAHPKVDIHLGRKTYFL